jgi:hypothetical protein
MTFYSIAAANAVVVEAVAAFAATTTDVVVAADAFEKATATTLAEAIEVTSKCGC